MLNFKNFRGTNDNGWFCGRVGICGAVGVVSTLLSFSSYVFGLVDIFVLSFFCASKSILYSDDENIQKILQIKYVLHLLGGLLVCV